MFEVTLLGCTKINNKIFSDNRGSFQELWKESQLNVKFVQSNLSRSNKNVVRGMHFQRIKPQGKLVRVLSGMVIDVAIDLRKDSKTFGCLETFYLTPESYSVYIPEGFGHGFWSLEDDTLFHYQCTNEYFKTGEGGINPMDTKVNYPWHGLPDLMISEKDKDLPSLSVFFSEYRGL